MDQANKMSMQSKRWESYIMYHRNKEIIKFWDEFYKNKPSAKVLFLLGKGFDPRMNNILKLILENNTGLQLDCIAFDFPEGSDPTEKKELYNTNTAELEKLRKKYNFGYKEITIDSSQRWDKRIAQMSRQIIQQDLTDYNDVILDVSSLPRAFYFNIAKVLFNKLRNDKKRNLFFAVSENVEIDKRIKKTPQSDIEPLVGFRSMSSRESNLDRINILISLIGEQNDTILRNIYNQFQPSDMFPVLPFPSKDPRRSDTLMQRYHEFFREKQFTEPQNITYADEQNPFELYRIVSNMIRGHQATFRPISEHICFGIALLTSKLLSLGALLVGLEYNDCVVIYNVSSTNYEIDSNLAFEQINKTSEPFLLWITGEAYNEE